MLPPAQLFHILEDIINERSNTLVGRTITCQKIREINTQLQYSNKWPIHLLAPQHARPCQFCSLPVNEVPMYPPSARDLNLPPTHLVQFENGCPSPAAKILGMRCLHMPRLLGTSPWNLTSIATVAAAITAVLGG